MATTSPKMAAAAPKIPDGSSRVRVAVRIRDPAMRVRVAAALRDVGALLVDPEAEADMVIADESREGGVSVIEVVSAEVRARIPGDVAAATLGALVAVVAAGMTVAPRATAPSAAAPGAFAPRESVDAVAHSATAGSVASGSVSTGPASEAPQDGGSAPDHPAPDRPVRGLVPKSAAASPPASGAALQASLPAIVDDEPFAALTAREREVLAILAEGASNKAIARELGISIGTVKFHVASLIEKLGAKNRGGAVAAAIRSGLVMV